MAITVKIEEKQNKEISFPCLMRHKEGFVVLFTKPQSGVVVVAGAGWKLGEHDADWDWPESFIHEWEPSHQLQ